MKKKKLLYFMVLVVLFSLFMISCSEDSSTEPDDNDPLFTEFYGTPTINPSAIFTAEATDVTIRASISANPNLMDNGVNLVRVDGDNNVVEAICQLFDDGDLTNGDEILGDNVYSAIHSFNLASAGEIRLRVAATTLNGNDEIIDYSSVFLLTAVDNNSDADYIEVSTMQENIGDTFETNLDASDIETALEDTYNWITQQPGIENAEMRENGIMVEYENGIMGGIMVYQADEQGEIDTKGWNSSKRQDHHPIKVEYQTRGINNNIIVPKVTEEEDVIGNNNILIWAPFEAAFKTDMRPSLETIIENTEQEVNLVTMADAECTIASLYSLTDYGLIIFDSHGSEGKELGTAEEVTNWTFVQNYINLLLNRVSIWTNVKVGYNGGVAVRKDIFAIHAPFINSLPGTFQNALIFNGSCESTMNSDLKDAFLNKGAKTYFGFDKVVNTTFCKNVCDDIVQAIVVDFENTGDAFTAGQNDPQSPNALFEMYGSEELHYSMDLINGDFEYGNLTGWSRSGDGRVITQLAYMGPTQGSFMGIISTGLGYTTDSGSIYQSFRVPENDHQLSFKWNFLSEELMEWVGSQYQDYFKVAIIDNEGYESTILYKDVDEIAENYGPYLVSPDIEFDVGDVYATGWNTFSYDLNFYAGQIVTIKFTSGDVGDSAYDTAILLDEIKVGED
ncbi:MAG: hypothetical protein APR54_13080 [Candidatus Cloacimonas sp. SDB]|nr:MAG: hypothetical protein APR54_13080 [Candidatus Cloacimonas sp. SDB]